MQSFVDITDHDTIELKEESKSFVSRKSGTRTGAQVQGNGADQAVMAVTASGPSKAYQNASNILDVDMTEITDRPQAHLGNQNVMIEGSAQYTDMAAHTPLRLFGVSSESRK